MAQVDTPGSPVIEQLLIRYNAVVNMLMSSSSSIDAGKGQGSGHVLVSLRESASSVHIHNLIDGSRSWLQHVLMYTITGLSRSLISHPHETLP